MGYGWNSRQRKDRPNGGNVGCNERAERLMISNDEDRWLANLEASWGRALPCSEGRLNDHPAESKAHDGSKRKNRSEY